MHRFRGFTLIELMVTLAVAAILLAAGAPSFAEFLRANRVATASNELVTALQLARSEALKRGRPVSLCPSSNQATCSGSTTWTSGWLVFQDAAASGTPSPAGAGAELIRVWQPLQTGLTLTAPVAYYRFAATGATEWPGAAVVGAHVTGSNAVNGASSVIALTVDVCRNDGNRNISVSRLGRVRTQKAACL